MSDHCWEVTTRRGNTLRISLLSGEHRFTSYECRLIDTRTGEEFHEEITPEQKAELVEFLGYPAETTERADRYRAQLEQVTAERDQIRTARRQLIEELQWVQGTVKDLIELLRDAWWIKAADAHDALSNWVHHHVVPEDEQ